MSDSSRPGGPKADAAASPDQHIWQVAAPEVIATRLARMLWDADAPGSLQAQIGVAPNPAVVRQIAAHMLNDARARAGVGAFYRWWLRLDDLTTLPKQDVVPLSAELREAMRKEAEAAGVFATLESNGTFHSLMTASYTFVNEALAQHYGIAGVRGGELQRVPYPTAERLGITGGAGVLTRFASYWQPTWPAKRSWLVDGMLLCGVLPESAPFAEKPDPNRSIRRQMIEVTATAECQRCHRRINGPGFAFLKFDTFGRYVDSDAGEPADASGRLPAEVLPDQPSFNDQPSLARLLAERAEARACLAQAVVQFAIAPRKIPHPRMPPSEAKPSIAAVGSAFEAADGNLRALFLAVVETEAFLTASPPVWE